MKVYLLKFRDYYDDPVTDIGVFSTQEKAKDYVVLHKNEYTGIHPLANPKWKEFPGYIQWYFKVESIDQAFDIIEFEIDGVI